MGVCVGVDARTRNASLHKGGTALERPLDYENRKLEGCSGSTFIGLCADVRVSLVLVCSTAVHHDSQTRVHGTRGSFRSRGGGPGHPTPPANWSGQGPPPGMSSSNWHYIQNPDKEPPPGYVCFRCGQKGELVVPGHLT